MELRPKNRKTDNLEYQDQEIREKDECKDGERKERKTKTYKEKDKDIRDKERIRERQKKYFKSVCLFVIPKSGFEVGAEEREKNRQEVKKENDRQTEKRSKSINF